ncbi:MAG: HAMP domain-containing histidine kinase [Gammaproteobacteria bacterium]|nr:HAMP domain-containing histidine kinase [Gammaproteobacteria bacterium]
MVNLATGFMEMAALNQQTTLAELQYFSLQALLNMSIASIAPVMIGKGIVCHRVLSEGLPAILYGQSLFIHRIIANLLQNSVAVIESGQVIVQAGLLSRMINETTTTDVGQPAILSKQALLKLKMTAIGKQRNPSFQSHGVQINLRLQIVKKIIELIGGRFEFEQLGA